MSKKCSINSREDQQRRLKVKNLGSLMETAAVKGTGMSPWEARVLVDIIEEVYFSDPELCESAEGRLRYQCVSAEMPAGKPIGECSLITVLLTLFDKEDEKDLGVSSGKGRSAEIRSRRMVRIADEAREQGGLLSQEDIAKLLMCDVRTVRRDIAELLKKGVVVATRGQQKDIGPGVTHRAIAIRHWLEGKEPVEVARAIKHSLGAVENYLEKFKRVSYLRGKEFQPHEIAMTVGISVAATSAFLDIYHEFRGKPFFKSRMAEINLVGSRFYMAQDEKKDSASQSESSRERRKP